MNMLTEAISKYAVFSGRARRKEYWGFVLLTIIIYILAVILDVALEAVNEDISGIFIIIAYIGLIIPSLAVLARRLHDTNRSAWWILISLVPLVGGIVLLVFTVTEGNAFDNRFGANPKKEEEQARLAALGITPGMVAGANTASSSAPASSSQSAADKWILSGFDGGGNTVRHTLSLNDVGFKQDGVIIGRDAAEAALVIKSDSISRRHARIFYSDSDIWVEDLNSTNGTVLNGNRLKESRAGVLSNGAKLVLGDVELILTRVD